MFYARELKASKYSQLGSLSRCKAFPSWYEQFQGKRAVYSSDKILGQIPNSFIVTSILDVFKGGFFFLQIKFIITFASFSRGNYSTVFHINQKGPDSEEDTL